VPGWHIYAPFREIPDAGLGSRWQSGVGKGVILVSTTHAPPLHAHRPHVNAWLVAVVGLAAGLIALGSWVLIDRYTGGNDATHDAKTLIDKLNVAFSTGDAKAIPSLYATNAVMRTIGVGETYVGVNAIRALADGSYTVERVAPVTVEGEYATTFVRLSAPGYGTGVTISVFQIKDGKVVRQWNFVPGQTAPFDNAVMP
jgi:predicted SnoaL-like aldol condensation-catalyzing enzyme